MKIQGTFMASRAGRRIFWTLLLAAAAPIATFGVAMHAMLSAKFESQAVRQQVQLTKIAGMGLLDRLLVARTTLDVVARTGRGRVGCKAEGRRRGRVLRTSRKSNAQGRRCQWQRRGWRSFGATRLGVAIDRQAGTPRR